MKIHKILSFLFLAGILFVFPTCETEDEFLTEQPKSFLAPENVFLTTKGFNTALNGCYHMLQKEWSDYVYGSNWSGTDLAINGLVHGSYQVFESLGEQLTSENTTAFDFWNWSYLTIANVNTILGALDNPDVSWDTPDDKTDIEAQARFIRAYAYRTLSYSFGGVPIVEEVGKPFRLDYTRATLDATLDFMIADFTFAANNLPGPDEITQEGRIVAAAAQHLLAEAYVYKGEYATAEPLLESIISSGDFSLMTARFGNHTGEPGDVFSDLFKEFNQNRSQGNQESIWVLQYQYEWDGGPWEFRNWSRRAWVPYYSTVSGLVLCDSFGGRGVGRLEPTQFWLNSYEAQDIRNSRHNIRRHYYINDINDPNYGQELPITADTRANGSLYESTRKFDFGKTDDWPTAPFNMKDRYKIRLANTYLLLAEAEFRLGKTDEAATHINAVRARSNATPITAGDVDIDFILDETARELFGEYPRKYELTRTGEYVNRVKAHNPVTSQFVKAYNIYWPIPQTAIDANSEAELKQNDGY